MPGFPFEGEIMIQDIGEHTFDNTYRAATPVAESPVYVVRGNEVALTTARELADWPRLRFAFTIDDEAYFIAPFDVVLNPADLAFKLVHFMRAEGTPETVLGSAVAVQLARWYETSRCCPWCGAPLAHAPASRELVCTECAHIVYPKVTPGIIAGVIDRETNRIVLTTYANRPGARPALVAGFAEVGESLEGCLCREVREEVGLEVTNLRYVGSQPWPYSDSLLVGFFCEVTGSRDIVLEEAELKRAEWVSPEDMPSRESDHVSLTGHMMRLFAAKGAAVLD